jgi:hypothetical protein
MKSLKSIGENNEAWPAAEVWDRHDKGELMK